MTKVQHTARLHEETVQKIARGERLPNTQRRHTTHPKGWKITVNKAVMLEARRIRRPGTRISIINEDTVLIINKKEN